MRKLVLLALLGALTLFAQTKKIVVMGMSEDMVSELRDASPSSVNIVHITNPNSNADVVAIVADSPEDSARSQALLKEVADADAIIGTPSREVVNSAKKAQVAANHQRGSGAVSGPGNYQQRHCHDER